MSNSFEAVVNNEAKQRFEVHSGAQLSRLDYRMEGERIAIVHTEVPEDLSGQGIGSALVHAALTHARERKLEVLPYCPFAAAYLARHPEWNDIVAEL